MDEKKLHRFFISAIPNDLIFELTDQRLIHQLLTVLRYTVGKTFIAFGEGTDDHVVSIVGTTKHAITVKNEYRIPARAHAHRELIAAVSITKRDTFELVVQKLTELGVHTLVPVQSARTIKHGVRLDRLQLIQTEALEQSGGNRQMRILEPLTLNDCFEQFPFQSVVFDPHISSTDSEIPEGKTVMYIGPEGGWSAADKVIFEAHQTISRSLGPTILRTETAAIVGAYELLRPV